MSASRHDPNAIEAPADATDRTAGLNDPVARSKLKKAPNAFRTISEVADDLHIPQHVLRFWESKFPQVKPLKRGGGRRYYRPDDIGLLRRISDLLYIQGYTIKGVQRLLREGGGSLSDDIPPPTAEERDPRLPGDDDLPQQPIPGLSMLANSARPITPIAAPISGQASITSAGTSAGHASAAAAADEVTALREALRHVLHELETLRGLIVS